MANYKNRRPKKCWGCCQMCRPWRVRGKRNSWESQPRQEQLARIGDVETGVRQVRT